MSPISMRRQWGRRALLLAYLLFTLARRANAEAGVADVPWAPRAGEH